MTAAQAAEFATLAGVQELFLMHFAPRYAWCYQSLVEEARAVFPRVLADLDGPG
jgi:ribonuclease BN (tRNA processing enzyme)